MARLYGNAATAASRLYAGASPAAPKASEGGFGANLLKSGGNFLEGIVRTVAHPIDTVSGVLNLGQGAVEKLVPGRQEEEKYVDALGGYVKDRYGGFENTKKTLYQDPVGALADLSTVLGGGSALLRGAGAVTKVGALDTAADVAATASRFTDPLRLPGAVAKPLLAGKAEATSERLMQSALKPSKSLERNHPRVDVVHAALDEGVTVGKGGLRRVQGRIEDVNDEIAGRLAESGRAGATVNPAAVARRSLGLKDRFLDQVSPQEDLAAIDSKTRDFLAHPKYSVPSPKDPSVRIPQPIPIEAAQAMKRGTYRELRGKFGQERTAGIEAEKALARGLKEEIASQVPEIAQLNERDSRLIALEDGLTDAVRRLENRNIVSWRDFAALALNPKLLVAEVIDHPTVKSALANIVRRGVPSLPGSSNPVLDQLYTLLSPFRATTPKSILTNQGNP